MWTVVDLFNWITPHPMIKRFGKNYAKSRRRFQTLGNSPEDDELGWGGGGGGGGGGGVLTKFRISFKIIILKLSFI